ncbi:hypothetical protein PHLGIDRAFT_20900 [Phlebiopsis gigantea 11061_1 CR5-6]|uniref:Uncharacterized protein n=1 Tax=Phlebiopsis gigantea (strain 11061_1 CR5-6) TaxID=745531 RepID=A0A0C3P3C3_PHLG1|nr:hypothetical protein PHLGIDRAFT_20900 [Phlebiopsis gigantea 11061_1 CR5-6]
MSHSLLGLHPSDEPLLAHVQQLYSLVPSASTIPEVKSYPDAVYLNHFPVGLSLLFKPVNGYKPKTGLRREELDDAALVLDGIDVYNNPPPNSGAATAKHKSPYAPYPSAAFALQLVETPGKPRAAVMQVTPITTGKEFVAAMGEPDRKGGGAGPSSGSIGIWCEWSKDGVMVEFGGDESRGPQAWEKGKDAIWKIISIFPPA